MASIENSCCELINKFIGEINRVDWPDVLAEAEGRYCCKEFKISQISPKVAA